MNNSYKVAWNVIKVLVRIAPFSNYEGTMVQFVNMYESEENLTVSFDNDLGYTGMVRKFIVDNGLQSTTTYEYIKIGDYDYLVSFDGAQSKLHADSGLWY